MNVTATPTARLDGRHIYVKLVPDPGLGEVAEWMLSLEAATLLRDELGRVLRLHRPVGGS